MTINNTFLAYANEALSYYQAELDTLDNEVHEAGFSTLESFISADIRDLYRNGNLDDYIPSITELSEMDYETETTMIHDFRETLADYIAKAIRDYRANAN